MIIATVGFAVANPGHDCGGSLFTTDRRLALSHCVIGDL